MTSFHFESCLRKVNYRINHAEGQAETSLQVLHACMNIFHFWLTQYVTIAVCRGREKKKKKRSEKKKKSTLLNWCTTHVSASWLGREIRGKCRKTCFLLQCAHFPFNSGYRGFLTSQKLRLLYSVAISTTSRHINSCEQQTTNSFLSLAFILHDACACKHTVLLWDISTSLLLYGQWYVKQLDGNEKYIMHHHVGVNVIGQQGSYLLNIDFNI